MLPKPSGNIAKRYSIFAYNTEASAGLARIQNLPATARP
jgi:hypothetical protein